MHGAYACLLSNGLDGAGEALRILVNQASRIERAQYLQAMPYERSAQRVDQANGYKPKTMLTRMDEITFEVPQMRSGGFYPSACSGTAQNGSWRQISKNLGQLAQSKHPNEPHIQACDAPPRCHSCAHAVGFPIHLFPGFLSCQFRSALQHG